MRCNKEICKINRVDPGKNLGKKAAKSVDFSVVRSCVCYSGGFRAGNSISGAPVKLEFLAGAGKEETGSALCPKIGGGGAWRHKLDFSRDSQGMG